MADRARQVSASPSNGLAYKPHTGKPERPPRFSRAQERMSDIIRRIEKECFIDRPVPCASDSDLARHMLSEPVVKQTRFGDLDASHGEREQGCQSVIEWRHEYDPQAPATTCRHIVSTLFPAHVHTPQLKARRPVLRHSPDQVRMQRALPVGSDDDDDEGDRSCDDRQDDVLLDSEAARFFQATRELARDVRLLARQDGQTLRHTWDALELDCVEIVKAAYAALFPSRIIKFQLIELHRHDEYVHNERLLARGQIQAPSYTCQDAEEQHTAIHGQSTELVKHKDGTASSAHAHSDTTIHQAQAQQSLITGSLLALYGVRIFGLELVLWIAPAWWIIGWTMSTSGPVSRCSTLSLSGQVEACTLAPAQMTSILSLPTELIFRIVDSLSAVSVSRLSSTCKALHDICHSDELWKDRIRDLWLLHGATTVLPETDDEQVDRLPWAEQWSRFLGRHRHFLGWWASSLPFRGRVIRMQLCTETGTLDTLYIAAQLIEASNAIQPLEDANDDFMADVLPQGFLWDVGSASYSLPLDHPSPDRGYSIDVLDPTFQHVTLFTIHPEHGVTLNARPDPRASQPFIFDALRPVSLEVAYDVLGVPVSAGSTVTSLFTGEKQTPFPTIYIAESGILRPFEGDVNRITEDDMQEPYFARDSRQLQCPHLAFTPRYTKSDEPSNPAMPLADNGGPRMLFQTGNVPQWIDQPPELPQLIHMFNGGNGPEAIRMNIHRRLNAQSRGRFMTSDAELFMPIRAPSDPVLTMPGNELRAIDLTGLWVGTYSVHGLEFGYINVKEVQSIVHAVDEIDLEELPFDGSSTSLPLHNVHDAPPRLGSASLRPTRMRRRHVIEFIKVTGDLNVPRGEISWIAFLPEEDGSEALVPLEQRTVRALDRTQMETWSHRPFATIEAATAAWSHGTLDAKGKVAFSGFLEPRWSDAQAIIISSRTEMGVVVDEIRLRWLELGKTSSYKRVRARI
ncbi:uncharacterized protein L969DRAFT_94434 [Mixia osmundae IAM 14324]|uniref:F-box domain-containing protein n=1 Tax=Mixia osmundae (strain CBS 9802 / IAM 14324 / JCM 22182 / KY 12970) TaxID=764103 RepID=G7E3G7_MIXOS|nr:uncharacterized protein L969DRAFT_94434 [Mixia osmundae IAM 14324]KEI39364.1 hypothetical protein L969DRAFT_94434 [Mixia osmundae IAM 14324]GAA97377.1 hypothetical protein E5Q_04055 [Mixia osmundae IAM 14324]